MIRVLSVLLLSLVLAVSTASAEVVRIEITSRSDVADGKTYGLAGAFERIEGTIYFAVDPNNQANRIITDIDYAPRNADGKVEFRSDFYLIKPKDISRGNGTLFYEVSNRGGKGMLGYFNNARGSRAPQTTRKWATGSCSSTGSRCSGWDGSSTCRWGADAYGCFRRLPQTTAPRSPG